MCHPLCKAGETSHGGRGMQLFQNGSKTEHECIVVSTRWAVTAVTTHLLVTVTYLKSWPYAS